MFPPLNVLLDFFYSLNHHEILLYWYAEVGTSDRIAIFRFCTIAIGLRKNNRNIDLAKLSDFKYRTSKTRLPIVDSYWTSWNLSDKTGRFWLFFFTKFRSSDEFFANFCENSRVVGVSTVSGISAALCVAVVAYVFAVACESANECVPDVAGVPLVHDVLSILLGSLLLLASVLLSAFLLVLSSLLLLAFLLLLASLPILASLYYCS